MSTGARQPDIIVYSWAKLIHVDVLLIVWQSRARLKDRAPLVKLVEHAVCCLSYAEAVKQCIGKI